MPRRSSFGRGGPVIPAGWTATAASVLGDTIARSGCTVTIGPAGGAPGWNAANKVTETAPIPPVYNGPATITVVSDSSRRLDAVDENPRTRMYEVRLPLAQDDTTELIEIGHQVTVVTDPDPQLAGARLRVESIERDTRRFSRILYAVLVN